MTTPGLPLPLGATRSGGIWGRTRCGRWTACSASIRYGLEHRAEALQYALGFGRGLQPSQADGSWECT